MKISTRKIALVGIMSALTGLMSAVPFLGYIPVPGPAGAATILHIPTIVAGALGGPLVGGFTGLIFGASSFIMYGGAVGNNVIVIFLPRILIGIAAALIYRGLRKKNKFAGAVVAGGVGALVNSVGVLGLALLFGLFTWPMVAATGINVITEFIVSLIICTALIPPLDKLMYKNGDPRGKIK